MKKMMIGAEVFIEPGQRPEEIDLWFKRLKECGMTITRIRMFESYMHQPDGSWNFELFDTAFKAGEKYGVKIFANLFPSTEFTDVGGFKFPKSEENLQQISDYIRHLVSHFKDFSSLYGWVPINEPGSGELPDDDFSRTAMAEWKKSEITNEYNSQGFNTLDFSKERFLLHHNTWFLRWLTDQIHLHDPNSIIHVNNHAIFQHVAEYDFPEWRNFLTSLGGSAHVSWHFGYFSRQQYAVAMSANAEILRSGAGDIPWLMTELQGGNNTYSAFAPMCPTKEEIAQWLWITIGAGSEGSIFWCLNPRRSGFEAGEWAMLDYQDHPSDRMLAAAAVINTINDHAALFEQSTVLDAGIHILYSRESLWIEKALQIKGTVYDGREQGGCMKSALAWFEALTELGVHASFKEIGEFDFSKDNYETQTIVLAHQISLPSKYWDRLKLFVELGGKLIAEGLTAYYDENAYTLMGGGFPFRDLFGAAVKEFKVVENLFTIKLNTPYIELPAHLWRGTLKLESATAAGYFNGEGDAEAEVIASRNTYGKGEVFWLPSLIGLGSGISGSYTQLTKLIREELKISLSRQPLLFAKHQPHMVMKTLVISNGYLTILVNKSGAVKNIVLKTNVPLHPELLFANRNGKLSSAKDILIHAEETMVIKWINH